MSESELIGSPKTKLRMIFDECVEVYLRELGLEHLRPSISVSQRELEANDSAPRMVALVKYCVGKAKDNECLNPN